MNLCFLFGVLIITSIIVDATLNIEEFYDRCYSSTSTNGVGCIAVGEDNCISRKNCQHLVIYQSGPLFMVDFSLASHRVNRPRNQYISIGFSYDDLMGDDVVVACSTYAGKFLDVWLSYNKAYPSRKNVNTLLRADQQQIHNPNISINNGHLLCSFSLHPAIRVSVTSKSFNIRAKQFRLLIASGPMNKPNKLGYHLRHRSFVTPSSINFSLGFTSIVKLSKEKIRIGMAVHIFFTTVTFMSIIPTAILICRFQKESHVKIKITGYPLWFLLHIGLNISGIALLLLAVAVLTAIIGIFPRTDRVVRVHYYVGLVVLLLALVTLSIGTFLFACGRQPRRTRESMSANIHPILGTITWLLGMVQIFLSPYTVPAQMDYCTIPSVLALSGILLFVITALALTLVLLWSDAQVQPPKDTPIQTEAPNTSLVDNRLTSPSIISLQGSSIHRSNSPFPPWGTRENSDSDDIKSISSNKNSGASSDYSGNSGSILSGAIIKNRSKTKRNTQRQIQQPVKHDFPVITEIKLSTSSASSTLSTDTKRNNSKFKPRQNETGFFDDDAKVAGQRRTQPTDSIATIPNRREVIRKVYPEMPSSKIRSQHGSSSSPGVQKTFLQRMIEDENRLSKEPVQIIPRKRERKIKINCETSPDYVDRSTVVEHGLVLFEAQNEDLDFWSRIHSGKIWSRWRALTQYPLSVIRGRENPKSIALDALIAVFFSASLILALTASWYLYPRSLNGKCMVDPDNDRYSQWF